MNNKEYYKVYDFTNENVSCLKNLYNFKSSKVLTIVGSGDQYFSSILYGANKVDLFDVNPTSYLYFILKFYSIRELSYEEFYNFLILKNIKDLNTYNKLKQVLPKEVLEYYEYLILNANNKKNILFRNDGVNLLSRKNQKYYFKNDKTVIPYFIKENYYKLQNILKKTEIPNFYNCNLLNLKSNINENYDIMLLSNIYNSLNISINEFTKLLVDFDIPQIEACYDWHGWYKFDFEHEKYSTNIVLPSSPNEYSKSKNYIYSFKK